MEKHGVKEKYMIRSSVVVHGVATCRQTPLTPFSELIINTKWNGIIKDNNIEVNITKFYEKVRQIRVKYHLERKIPKRKVPRQKIVDEEK